MSDCPTEMVPSPTSRIADVINMGFLSYVVSILDLFFYVKGIFCSSRIRQVTAPTILLTFCPLPVILIGDNLSGI